MCAFRAKSCICFPPPAAKFCIQSPATGGKFVAKDRERRAIVANWFEIRDKETLGQEIFRNIFMSKPSLKRLWGLERESIESLDENLLFRQHARNFVVFLDVAVKSLSHDGLYMISLAQTVGKRHVLYKEVSFDPEYWFLYRTAVLEVLNPHISSTGLKRSWKEFVTFLVIEVKEAFFREALTVICPPKPCLSDGNSAVDEISGDSWATKRRWTSNTVQFQLGRSFAVEKDENRRLSDALMLKRRRQILLELRGDLMHILACFAEDGNTSYDVNCVQLKNLSKE